MLMELSLAYTKIACINLPLRQVQLIAHKRLSVVIYEQVAIVHNEPNTRETDNEEKCPYIIIFITHKVVFRMF